MAQEGLDAVLAASVFEQDISVLFMDEGVWQLHNHPQSHGIQHPKIHQGAERKNISAQIEAFPLYDINNVYADQKSIKRFSLTGKDLVLKPKPLGDKAIKSLLQNHQVILSY